MQFTHFPNKLPPPPLGGSEPPKPENEVDISGAEGFVKDLFFGFDFDEAPIEKPPVGAVGAAKLPVPVPPPSEND